MQRCKYCGKMFIGSWCPSCGRKPDIFSLINDYPLGMKFYKHRKRNCNIL